MIRSLACAHCGLPVPAGLLEPGAPPSEQYCCNGCRTVASVIRGFGLESFYRLRDASGAAPVRAATTGRAYAEFDDPTFRSLHCATRPDGASSVELYLEGVHCAACVWIVEKLPRVVEGVVEARLDLRRSLVRVVWEEGRVSLSRVARALDSLGYPSHPARDARARALHQREDRRFLVRIGVAAACAGNVMVLAFALYGGMFSGIEEEYAALFRRVSAAIGLVALFWPGSLFLRGAWAALRTRTANLDLPIALALVAGGAAGTVNAITGRGEVYFDTLTMLVFLLLAGRWIQLRQQRWASDAVELLYSLTPSSARLVTEGAVREVPVEVLGTGDIVEVRAGETIPADGVVERGDSALDESTLTGESRPVDVGPGGSVHAGTVNLGAALRVRVEATGAASRLGRLMELVAEGSRRRAPIVQLADRVAGWFVLAVLALAAATAALWLRRDPSAAVDHAVALLIATCPCALGLATPLALTVAIGRAARGGILIKGADALEQLARRGTFCLDKTGTITDGRTRVVTWKGAEDVKPLVARLEEHSSHPVARALVRACGGGEDSAADAREARRPPYAATMRGSAPERHAANAPVQSSGTGGPATAPEGAPEAGESGAAEDLSVASSGLGGPATAPERAPEAGESGAVEDLRIASSGVEGTLGGVRVIAGSPAFVRGRGAFVPEEVARAEQEVLRAALTPVIVARGGTAVAVAGLGDPVREDAAAAVSSLAALGWRVSMLSGDHPAVVEQVAHRIGIPPERALGGATPERKLAWVRRASEAGRVVMVGDGVNDAAALSAAAVGIAVHGSAEASLAAADIYVNRPGVAPLVALVRAAQRALGAIRRCLAVSLLYNAVAAGLAMAGMINPLIAAILMPVSSFTVLLLAWAQGTPGDDPCR